MDAGCHDRVRHVCPPQHAQKLSRAADLSGLVPAGGVPDPHYGDAGGFEWVVDVVEAVCESVWVETAQLGTWVRAASRRAVHGRRQSARS